MCSPARIGPAAMVPGWSVRLVWCWRSTASRSRSASVADRITCGGRPTRTEPAGITVPGGTSVPSPRMHPLPRRDPGMRIAPLPISHKSPIVAPTMVARWPKTVRWPTRTG